MTKDYLAVVQITDTHLFSQKHAELCGVCTDESLRAVLEALGRCQQSPDLILLTGDLVHDESRAGYMRLRELLCPLEIPIYCISGNHDDPRLMKQVFAKSNISMNEVIIKDYWDIFLLNTYVSGEVGGKLQNECITTLAERLKNNRNKHVMVCLHHHPIPIGCKWLDPLGLEEPQRLLGLIEENPQVKPVSWGHIHQEWDEQRAACRFLATPSTCVQFMPKADVFTVDPRPPAWRWLHLYDDGHIETGVERVSV